MPSSHEIATRLLVLAACCFCRAAWAENVDAVFDDSGLKSLRHGGVEFVGDGRFQLVNAKFQTFDGTSSILQPAQTSVRFDPAARVATLQSSKLAVKCAYEVGADRVTFAIEVTNKSDAVLRGVCLQLLDLKLPHAPRGWKPFLPCLGHNLGWPTIAVADFGDQTVAVCNEDMGRPLIVGFPGALSFDDRPVWVSSANIGWLSPYLDPLIHRPIYPGGTDRYRISLRFATGSMPASEIGADLNRKFAATYPPTLHWSDRRLIGTLYLGQHESHSDKNPRAWFFDRQADFSGAAGVAKFQKAALRYADESVRVLKGMNAQGMILWDAEGEEFPHATTYLGDPRSLPPEIAPIIDAFFKKFTDAGFRTGICIRPQRPVRPPYDDVAFQIDVADPEKNLSEKIGYAQKRWGCTLFYIDSNGDPNVPMDALVFKRLTLAHPDVLLMPEHKNAFYHAYTAPFYSFFHFGVTQTPAAVRAVYPEAFGAIFAPEGPIREHHAELVTAVRHGDILLFHGWFNDPSNPEIKRIYEEGTAR